MDEVQDGEPIYFIIEDTRIEKRGKKMEAVFRFYDHTRRCMSPVNIPAGTEI